jgi:transposase
MARAYSEDLRKKVISYIMSGGSKREASRVFKIGEDTVYRWLRLHKAGELKAKKRTVYPRKIDEEKLRDYVQLHPDHTLEQIAEALSLSIQTIFRWLRR